MNTKVLSTPIEEQLKAALVRALPDVLHGSLAMELGKTEPVPYKVWWLQDRREVTPYEWEHITHMVEDGLTEEQWKSEIELLKKIEACKLRETK
jgi:hypothetical protein